MTKLFTIVKSLDIIFFLNLPLKGKIPYCFEVCENEVNFGKVAVYLFSKLGIDIGRAIEILE